MSQCARPLLYISLQMTQKSVHKAFVVFNLIVSGLLSDSGSREHGPRDCTNEAKKWY